MFADNQKGVSLIITFFIMIIIVSVVLSISVILYSEVKVIRNIGNSVVSLYAADSGIEKVLYYDWQVIPFEADGVTPVPRGLCSMLDSKNPNGTDSAKYCNNADAPPYDSSVYCDSPKPSSFTVGCDPSVCDDCTISFKSDLGTGSSYTTKAIVYPTGNFEIDSGGSFGGSGRKIQILIIPPTS